MKKEVILQAMFDELVDKYSDKDEVSIEDVNTEMHEHFNEFLEAGFDATEIALMLSSEDVLDNHELLREHGAKIDANKVLSELDIDKVDDYWGDLVKIGITADYLAERFHTYDTDNLQAIKELHAKGVSVDTLFKVAAGYLSICCDFPDGVFEVFTTFSDYGLQKAKLLAWLEENKNDELVDDIMENNERWAQFSIDTSKLVGYYLEGNASFYLDDAFANMKKLPDTVTIENFFAHFTIDEILDSVSIYDISEWITDYLEINKDIDFLANKIVNESEYFKNLNEEDKSYWLEILRDNGANV